MALGSTRNLPVAFRGDSGLVAPVSLSSEWITAIDAGGVATADGSVTSPAVQITRSVTHILRRQNSAGTLLQIRLGYSASATPAVNPIVEVFGWSGTLGASGNGYQRLYSRSATPAATATLTTAVSTDVITGTLKFTDVDDDQTFDCQGCDNFLISVATAYDDDGYETVAIVEAKII